MSKPVSVSICVPTYNQIKYLPTLLSSVFNQTYTDYEVIISDDSSTEDVSHFIQEYLDKYSSIRYIRHKPSLGAPANWDYLQEVANGKYIKYLHHDDWFSEIDSLEIMVKEMEENNADFVFAASTSNYVNYNFKRYNYPTESDKEAFFKDPTRLIICNHVSNPSTTLFKRDPLIKFDHRMKWFVDVDFYINYLLKHSRIHGISKPLIDVIAFDEHNISNSCLNNKEVEIREYDMLLKKYLSKSKTPEALRKTYLSAISNYKITSIGEYKQYVGEEKISLFMIMFIKYIHVREFLIWKFTQLKRIFIKK
jgi:glycosyltransferase involved in cell wall biosynthesis